MRNLCFLQKCTVAYPAASNVVTDSSRSVKYEFLDCGLTILWVTHLVSPDNCIYFFLFQPHVSEDVGVVPRFSLSNYSSLSFPPRVMMTRWLCFSVPVHVLSHHLSSPLCCTLFLSYYTHLYASSFEPLPFLSSYSSVILGHSRLHVKTH